MPTMCCCTSLQACPTPIPTTFQGTCRRDCIGITVIFMGSLRPTSIQASPDCWRSDERTATCRSSRRKTFPSGTWRFQYNFVFDRAGGLAQLNNVTWPQWVSTITPPKPGELANGTYQPSLAPVNFKQSKPGTKYGLVCGAAFNPQSSRNLPVHPQQSAALRRGGRQSRERYACRPETAG